MTKRRGLPKRSSSTLCALLGAWLGASALMYFVVTYNFTGFEEMFSRNRPLAERAGFDVANENAKKTSVLWVHASELNRVLFEVWGRAQLALGVLCLAVALVGRQGRLVCFAIAAAIALSAWGHFVLTPEIVELGRELDFRSRDPAPPELATFGAKHGVSLAVDLARFGSVALAAAAAIWRPRGTEREEGGPSGS